MHVKLIEIKRNGHWYVETDDELRGPFATKSLAEQEAKNIADEDEL
jgi:hypothetical protein